MLKDNSTIVVYLGFGGGEKTGDQKWLKWDGDGIGSGSIPVQGKKYCKYSSSMAK